MSVDYQSIHQIGEYQMNTQQYIKNVVTLKLNKDKCNGCGFCTMVCPHAVFKITNKKASIIDKDACMECGACSVNCPVEAIELQSGVGCAKAVITGILRGSEPTCDCSNTPKKSCC
jgi:NAD-dependent dihydropyrimidine dehydrogenase PreA subunit